MKASSATPSHAQPLAIFLKSLAGGGAQRVMSTLAGAFAARGHPVDLVLAQHRGAFAAHVPAGVRVIDLAARSPLVALPGIVRRFPASASLLAPYAIANPPRVFGAVPALAQYLEGARPHAMLSAVDFTNVAALFAQQIANGPTRQVASFHTHLSTAVEHSTLRRMRTLPWLLRRWLVGADGVAACSQEVARDLARLANLERDRVAAIANPVDVAAIQMAAREEPDHPWFRDRAGPVLMAVGRLAPEKDHTTLLRAFALVRQTRQVRLVIAGEGPERRRLEALARQLGIEGDVDLHGFVDNPHAMLARADLMLLSSRREGFGMVLVEALACGCPVVSSDCPSGPREILEGGGAGALVPVGDVQAMAEAASKALDARTDRARLRARAADFSLDSAVDRYLELLIGGRGVCGR